MATKFLVLSLLAVEPASGYDLAYRCKDSLGPIWTASHSQIYTTLHGLLDKGLVSVDDATGTGERKRVVYSITDQGREELKTWRESPIAYLPPRDPLLFWAQHLDDIPADIAHERLDTHEERAQHDLEHAIVKAAEIREGRNDVLERRRGTASESQLQRARESRAAIYDEFARRAQLEIEMVGRLRLLTERLQNNDYDGV